VTAAEALVVAQADAVSGAAGDGASLAAWAAAAEWIPEAWAWIVPATLQATVLLGLAWLADRLLVRRAWPQALSLVWLLALARFFLPPDLGSPVSVTRALGAPALAAAEVTPPAAWLVAGTALWLFGAAALVVARIVRRARLCRSLRYVALPDAWRDALASAAHRLGVRRVPRVATLDSLATPAVLGAFAPVLLLPRGWLERAPTRRDGHALLHELAHVARRDLVLDEVVALVRACFWFHPLVWIAASRLHALSELQCDQTVARALGGEVRSYRDTLVLATRDALTARAPAGVRALVGLGAAGRGSAMIVRIERLERAALVSLAVVRGASAALAVAVAACVLPMAPRADELREQARAVLASATRGERQSCFTLRAAAMVLSAESPSPEPTER
jgi:beta-lactamase regulating signal transducer with metallopeptidase domain